MLSAEEQRKLRPGNLFFATVPLWNPDEANLETTCYVVLNVSDRELTFCKTGAPLAELGLTANQRSLESETIVDQVSWFRDREASRAWAIEEIGRYFQRQQQTFDDFVARRMRTRTADAMRAPVTRGPKTEAM